MSVFVNVYKCIYDYLYIDSYRLYMTIIWATILVWLDNNFLIVETMVIFTVMSGSLDYN